MACVHQTSLGPEPIVPMGWIKIEKVVRSKQLKFKKRMVLIKLTSFTYGWWQEGLCSTQQGTLIKWSSLIIKLPFYVLMVLLSILLLCTKKYLPTKNYGSFWCLEVLLLSILLLCTKTWRATKKYERFCDERRNPRSMSCEQRQNGSVKKIKNLGRQGKEGWRF